MYNGEPSKTVVEYHDNEDAHEVCDLNHSCCANRAPELSQRLAVEKRNKALEEENHDLKEALSNRMES